jgi:hypothetical protein
MNDDIYNPTEYWTPDNLPDGYFLYDDGTGRELMVDADSVFRRLYVLDSHNVVENFHAVVHFGINFDVSQSLIGEKFKFNLTQS